MSPLPPPLKLQFGSALHTVYNRPFHADHVVIAPSLFGSELKATAFHGLREELQEIMRDVTKRPDWSFESDTRPNAMVPFPPRDLTAKSATFQDVVNRMGEYFDVDPSSTGVGVAYRRGQPVCHYRGGPNQGCRNITVLAVFGRSCTLSLRRSGSSSSSPAHLSLTNNSVVAFGDDVLGAHGWEYGIWLDDPPDLCAGAGSDPTSGPSPAPSSTSSSSFRAEAFTVLLHGRCATMAPSSHSPANVVADDSWSPASSPVSSPATLALSWEPPPPPQEPRRGRSRGSAERPSARSDDDGVGIDGDADFGRGGDRRSLRSKRMRRSSPS